MHIVVLGLWHLGCVTAACCSQHFQVTGIDFEPGVADGLAKGKPPIMEPGLDELLAEGIAAGRLGFTTDPAASCAEADILWVTYDTPVDDDDRPDPEFVLERVRRVVPCLREGAIVLLSSQLPVGTCARLEAEFPGRSFAVSPENLRLGRALDAFTKADRVIVGLRDEALKEKLNKLFAPFTGKMIFMRTESAEMVKHGLNSFLATSIVFINEIARLCERFGADAAEVAEGVKSDPRIGPRAYLRPGAAFAGGTLARDVVTLSELALAKGEKIFLLPAVLESNAIHRDWAALRLAQKLGDLRGKNVSVLGLTYTPNTDTLRRSTAVELCRYLVSQGARVRAYDPAIPEPVAELPGTEIARTIEEALRGADALVISTEWPEFLTAAWSELLGLMRRPLVLDANRFLEKQLTPLPRLDYVSVGRA
jgi:UDPglucose 6-dehydrogenase